MSSSDMNSKEIIQEYIQSSFKKWTVMEDENIDPKVAELVKLPNGETVIFSYANIAITGTERKKPQIRVFLHEFKHVLNYAKEKNYRFFLFTIFSKSQSMAKGLNAFDPHEYIVSLETNLDNESSRRDLRSLYDFVQTYVGNGGTSKFIRCPKESHNAGINQASFIYIGSQNNREKKFFEEYITYFDNRPYMQSADTSAFDYDTTEFEDACVFPSQIIYYGVPGCGKSNKIREQLKDVPEKNKVRVVFHPEYTNAEFIGQILPVTNDGIRYEFTPGPFTQIIKRAYLNPNEQFYLVIEEINRGNAAAIFGDTFQLLDRLKAGETDSLGNDPANAAVNTFTEGWSQYFVQNDDVNAYIRKTTKLDDGSYQERNDGEPIEEIKIKEIHFNANTAIRLPPNLSILATMNTSDQNVFTLDNAFQRRFDMELVRNEFDLTKPAVNAQYNAEIDDTGIKWGQFWGWINAKITATLKGLASIEDKRLGVWFVSNVGGIIDDKVFAEKVLKFLWDDVFKFKRPQIFADGIDTLEKLINFFEKPSEGKERFDVFKDKANLVAFEASPTL